MSAYNCLMHYRVGEISEVENRRLADPPSNSLFSASMSGYLNSLEQFYNDRFAARLNLQRMRSLLLVKELCTSSSPLVVLGQNGFMFYFTEDLSSNDALNPVQEKDWIQLLKSRRDFLNSHGIKYVLMLVPEKGTIETEVLPQTLKNNFRASRYKQMRDLLSAQPIVESVDLLPIFEKVQDKESLYYKTDSHWAYAGARLAAEALANKLHTSFPLISPSRLSHVKLIDGKISGDLVKMLNLEGMLSESSPEIDQRTLKAVVTSRTMSGTKKPSEFNSALDAADLPKAFVLHDSFTLVLQPFLSELFKEAKYYRAHSLPIKEILEFKPDVVIEEMAERNLYNLGFIDDLAFGSNPYFPVTQSINATMESSSAKSQQVEFATGECVQAISWQRQGETVSVSINWCINKDNVPNQIVELQLLDKSGKAVASTNYPQNPSYFVFSKDQIWTDKIDLKVAGGVSVDRVAIVLFKDRAHPTHVTAKLCDSGSTRAMF